MVQSIPPQPPAVEQSAEPQYPFGGFVFSGSEEALKQLKAAGEKKGLRFKPYLLSGHSASIMITGDDAFGKMNAVMELWNEAADGRFGNIVGGLISEPPASR